MTRLELITSDEYLQETVNTIILSRPTRENRKEMVEFLLKFRDELTQALSEAKVERDEFKFRLDAIAQGIKYDGKVPDGFFRLGSFCYPIRLLKHDQAKQVEPESVCAQCAGWGVIVSNDGQKTKCPCQEQKCIINL